MVISGSLYGVLVSALAWMLDMGTIPTLGTIYRMFILQLYLGADLCDRLPEYSGRYIDGDVVRYEAIVEDKKVVPRHNRSKKNTGTWMALF